MDNSKEITQMFSKLVNDYFDGSQFKFHEWILDNFNKIYIDTGKYLVIRPETEARNPFLAVVSNLATSSKYKTEMNIKDQELSIKVMKKHPNMWFVYSSTDSIAKLLTMRDLKGIAKSISSSNSEGLPSFKYRFISDKAKAERNLKKLL